MLYPQIACLESLCDIFSTKSCDTSATPGYLSRRIRRNSNSVSGDVLERENQGNPPAWGYWKRFQREVSLPCVVPGPSEVGLDVRSSVWAERSDLCFKSLPIGEAKWGRRKCSGWKIEAGGGREVVLRVAWEMRSRCGGSARIFALKLPSSTIKKLKVLFLGWCL